MDGRNDTELCSRREIFAFDKVSPGAQCEGTTDNAFVMAGVSLPCIVAEL